MVNHNRQNSSISNTEKVKAFAIIAGIAIAADILGTWVLSYLWNAIASAFGLPMTGVIIPFCAMTVIITGFFIYIAVSSRKERRKNISSFIRVLTNPHSETMVYAVKMRDAAKRMSDWAKNNGKTNADIIAAVKTMRVPTTNKDIDAMSEMDGKSLWNKFAKKEQKQE